MKTTIGLVMMLLLLSGCATERYGVGVSSTESDWVAVRIDRATGETCYTERSMNLTKRPYMTMWRTWTPIREKGKTSEKPDTAALGASSRHKADTAALEASSRHKAEMAKMTNEQLKTHLKDLREKYQAAAYRRKQADDALPRSRPGPTYYWTTDSGMETDQAIRNIEAQAALERAEEEEKASIPSMHEAESAYKERLHSQFKASQHLPAN